LAIVVMGVTGAGKTTVGRLLAGRIGCAFIEGDDYHPETNVAKMRAGEPLTDDDRAPWLAKLAAVVAAELAAGRVIVLACSALRQSYRDVLAGGDRRVLFVHLAGPRDLVARRLAGRTGHFMPAALLESQYATLEAPTDLTFWIENDPVAITDAVLAELTGRGLVQ